MLINGTTVKVVHVRLCQRRMLFVRAHQMRPLPLLCSHAQNRRRYLAPLRSDRRQETFLLGVNTTLSNLVNGIEPRHS
jgi:hypothetical protein